MTHNARPRAHHELRGSKVQATCELARKVWPDGLSAAYFLDDVAHDVDWPSCSRLTADLTPGHRSTRKAHPPPSLMGRGECPSVFTAKVSPQSSLEALLRTALDLTQPWNLEPVHNVQTRSILVVYWTHHWLGWNGLQNNSSRSTKRCKHGRRKRRTCHSKSVVDCRVGVPSRAVCVLQRRPRVRCVM